MSMERVLLGAVIGIGAVAAAPFTGGGSILGAATLAGSLSGVGTGIAAATAGFLGVAVVDNMGETEALDAYSEGYKDAKKKYAKRQSSDDETQIYTENYDDEPKISFEDSINQLKKHHPQIRTRKSAAKVFMMIFENGYWDEDNLVTRIKSEETFDCCKELAEKYCGIRNLQYKDGILIGGEIDETCPVTPKFTLDEEPCPTAKELARRYPELKVLLA